MSHLPNFTTTSVTFSWTPAWSHTVNNYTVSVIDTYGIVNGSHTVNTGTTWTITQGNTSYECTEINVTVTANTDVGSITSEVFHTGFPKREIKYYLLMMFVLFK